MGGDSKMTAGATGQLLRLLLLCTPHTGVLATVESGVVILTYLGSWQPLAKYSYNAGAGGTLRGKGCR